MQHDHVAGNTGKSLSIQILVAMTVSDQLHLGDQSEFCRADFWGFRILGLEGSYPCAGFWSLFVLEQMQFFLHN